MSSANSSSPPADDVTSPYSTSALVVLSLVIGVLTFLTLAGNSLVIAAFVLDKKLRTFGNFFILNLSITDLCVGVLIPIYAPYQLMGRWPFGRRSCVAFIVVDYIVPLASSWNIALISLDRYVSVTRPVVYRMRQSARLAAAFMSVPWIAGLLIFAPAIIFWERITGRSTVPDGDCWVEFYDHVPYLLFGSTMEFVVPFVIVSLANLLIYVNIRRRARSSGAAEGDQARSLARDRKTARSLAILVGVYFLTWGPYEVCAMMNPLCGFCVPDKVFEVTFWLLWTNSTINPILYPFLQLKFRVAFRRMLCGSCAGDNRVEPIGGDQTQNKAPQTVSEKVGSS